MTIGTKIAAAFLKAQQTMGNATKDSNNPYFKSKYADLNSVREACLPSLNENGICVLQPIVNIEGKNFVKTILLHESGETIESLTEILFAKANDPQAQGSGITYARRYGLQSLVNIGAEDDDGNKAAEKPKTPLQKVAEGATDDMKQLQRETNENDKKIIENLLNASKSEEEVQDIIDSHKKQLAKLSKYAPDLFVELKKVKDDLLAGFKQAREMGDFDNGLDDTLNDIGR